MVLDLFAGAQTIAPAMTRTMLASLTKKKGNEGRATDDPGYAETLDLMRQLIDFTAINTVEDVQHITTGWVPPAPSALVTDVEIPDRFYPIAAGHISENLGPLNLKRVGKTWWQWRKPGSVVRAEWVEMKSDYLERKANGDKGKKVMFYIHGGAYFFGSISHGPQIQRHARKLKGRVFAPRYRLAPQFPFPCAVQDILSAYLYLLTIQDPSHIVLTGDSAGGGLCVALLLILRDQGLPLPAGASLISPWVDLTHSFPSITLHTDFDYVPAHGFHAKPSISWPPPTTQEMEILGWPNQSEKERDFECEIDGEKVVLTDQFQIYAQNTHLQIPLVSSILAASLGGLCPLQVIVGGGEVLRDEQIYLAHKAADPKSYAPCPEVLASNGQTEEDVLKYPPTDVQLLIFDDCPHAAPTLGHTRGAKYQYRSVSQFAAWALARAQKQDIEIADYEDDAASISESRNAEYGDVTFSQVGRAGDPLTPFVDHMIRHRVDRFGYLFPLKPASGIRACTFPASEIGWPKPTALKGWFKFRSEQDVKYRSQKKKVFEQRLKNAQIGYIRFPDGEVPPPAALAGRRLIGQEVEREKERGRIGKGIVSLLFGRFDASPVSGGKEDDPANISRRKTVMYQPNELDSFNPMQAHAETSLQTLERRQTEIPAMPPMPEFMQSHTQPSVKVQRRRTDDPGFYNPRSSKVGLLTESERTETATFQDEEVPDIDDIEDIFDMYMCYTTYPTLSTPLASPSEPSPIQSERSTKNWRRRTTVYRPSQSDGQESIDTMVDWDGLITSASPESDIFMSKQWRMTVPYQHVVHENEDAVQNPFEFVEPPPAYDESTRPSRLFKSSEVGSRFS